MPPLHEGSNEFGHKQRVCLSLLEYASPNRLGDLRITQHRCNQTNDFRSCQFRQGKVYDIPAVLLSEPEQCPHIVGLTGSKSGEGKHRNLSKVFGEMLEKRHRQFVRLLKVVQEKRYRSSTGLFAEQLDKGTQKPSTFLTREKIRGPVRAVALTLGGQFGE